MCSPSESLGFDQNVQDCTINYSIPPISEDQLRLWLQNAPSFSTNISNFQSDNSNPSENSSLEDISLHGLDSALSNSNCRKSRRKEGCECGRHKRARSTEAHNLNERLRRKKLTQKMAALQEMIPNSIKKDQASTIDDAINYIKKLQNLVQMMSIEAGHAMFHSPVMMLPQRHQGIETPSLAPFPEIGSGRNGLCLGMPIGYPMGLYNPWLFQPSVIGSGLLSIQSNREQSSESMHANSISCFGYSPSANGEARPSKGATR